MRIDHQVSPNIISKLHFRLDTNFESLLRLVSFFTAPRVKCGSPVPNEFVPDI